jgi:hypothetical protein
MIVHVHMWDGKGGGRLSGGGEMSKSLLDTTKFCSL